MVDNFVAGSPVLSVAPSLFSKSEAILYDENVTRGLFTALRQTWDAKRRERQKEVLCWLDATSLSVHKSPSQNLLVLQRHFDEGYPNRSINLVHPTDYSIYVSERAPSS